MFESKSTGRNRLCRNSFELEMADQRCRTEMQISSLAGSSRCVHHSRPHSAERRAHSAQRKCRSSHLSANLTLAVGNSRIRHLNAQEVPVQREAGHASAALVERTGLHYISVR